MLMERDPARGPCGAFSQCIEDANGTKCVCQRGFEGKLVLDYFLYIKNFL